MANQDRPDTTRDARLGARLSVAQMNLPQRAAELCGRTLSEFVVAGAQDAARRVIAGHASIRRSREEQLAFVQDLLNPSEPNARLERAAQAYRPRTGAQRVDLARIPVEPCADSATERPSRAGRKRSTVI
jgi:uncharacterized protein (DUF1778 family)